ncbi:helix-turn-helix domain-containing protein [Nocardia otitidiscaviarum]|uniref:PucR family transcriptional regulator n=1 Tax=Nocardia otitidiscaviarum TaxID=1823 RepID=UPI0009E07CE3|nr:helix-turn-helix domain-containing protein [Nocardia otitidiscaviarum]MBF6133925.1 helix-turn-helix domain-containing protein [Nocardia otitidiscaviarum]MBF6484415.1 helix-turn-helix domain-containing protein [Nocardia otitidiscaviarum]
MIGTGHTATTTASNGLAAVQTISAPLHDARALSQRLVTHFTEAVTPIGNLPGEVLRGEVTNVTRTCVELATGVLEGHDVEDKVERLHRAGAEWAREGIPIGAIHRAVRDGVELAFGLVLEAAGPDDYARLMLTAQRFLEILALINAAFAVAYVREHRAAAAEHHTAVQTVTSALLAGRSAATMARSGGVEIADSYSVLALGIPAPQPRPGLDLTVAARRTLRRVQAALAAHTAGRGLSLLGTEGGTVLVPTPEPLPVADLVSRLSAATGVALTATVVHTPTGGIPEAAERAHELLDMVHRLQCAPGLYRFDDLAVEYQLTRPGPGREHLGALLDPLDEHPDLMETLRTYVGSDHSRQRTARVLGVHTNTVDYRLKRIAQLTGFDPSRPSGLWHLRSSLVARTYRNSAAGSAAADGLPPRGINLSGKQFQRI